MALNSFGLGFLFTAKDLATAKIGKLGQSVRKLGRESEAMEAKYTRSMKSIKVGTALVVGGLIGFGIINSVSKSFGQFEIALASTGAVMRATTKESDLLRNAAIKAGIETQFSPTEAIKGLENLGAAGLNARDAIKTLPAVLNLAAASLGQLDVAGAAANVVGVMNAFGESTDKASLRVDQLVRVTQISNFQARDFSVAISQSAAQANAADQSFESMIATLGVLRNTNLDASSASTAYREAVRRLSGDLRSQKELTKLSVDPLDKQTGKIKDLGIIVAELAPRILSLNAKERNLTLTRIFGVRGQKVFNAFMGSYNKLLKEGKVAQGDFAGAQQIMIDQLKRAGGTAKTTAEKLRETSQGQRILLKGSIDTFKVLAGETLTPILLPAIKAVTKVLNLLIKLMNKMPKGLKSFLTTAIGTALAVMTLVGAVKALRGVLGLLQLGRMATAAGAAGAGIGGLGSKVQGTTSRFSGMAAAAGTAFNVIAFSAAVAIPAVQALQAGIKSFREERRRATKQMVQEENQAAEAFRITERAAERMRIASARSLATRLKEATKSTKKAFTALDGLNKQVSELNQKSRKAFAEYIRQWKKTGEESSKAAQTAKAEWVKTQAKIEAVGRGQVRADALVAKARLGNAKTVADKQALGRKIVADRVLSQITMEKRLSAFKKRESKRIATLTPQEQKLEGKIFRRRVEREATRIRKFQRGTVRIADRTKLTQGLAKKTREEQGKLLRGVASPVVARLRALGVEQGGLFEFAGRVEKRRADAPQGAGFAKLTRFRSFAEARLRGQGASEDAIGTFLRRIDAARIKAFDTERKERGEIIIKKGPPQVVRTVLKIDKKVLGEAVALLQDTDTAEDGGTTAPSRSDTG